MPFQSGTQVNTLLELLAQMDAQGVTGYVRYREMKRFLERKAYEKGVPLTGTFELTPLCNLDCKMCYVHLESWQLGQEGLLDPLSVIGVVDAAWRAGMMYARLTGGECLTYPGFDRVYKHLRMLGVEVGVLTNGTLLTAERVDFFKRDPPAYLQISLYGSSEEAYERVTGSRAFGAVMNGIRLAKEAEIPIVLAITPNRFMLEDAEELLKLAKHLNLHWVVNSGLFAPREETRRSLNDADITLNDYVRIHQMNAELKGQKISPGCEEDLPEPASAPQRQRGIRCAAGMSAFSLGWNGIMRGCNTLDAFQARPLEIGFDRAWEQIHRGACGYRMPVECEECRCRDICKHCVAEHRMNAPEGHANPLICQWGHRMVAEGIVRIPERK